MPLSTAQKHKIEETITSVLRNKFRNYNPETSYMPFHHRLLGRDRMALFSFIQSLNTTFGTSIYEPVAEILAQMQGEAEKQYTLGDKISTQAQTKIGEIINELSMGTDTNCGRETEQIRRVAPHEPFTKTKTIKVDLFFRDKAGVVHLFDLKTAKPNKSNFKDFKRILLEWRALFLAHHPDADVRSYIAIPYNPYHPKPYERWTLKGMLDIHKELKVAEEFWNFLGGEHAYEDILTCFEKVGIRMRGEIDDYFSSYHIQRR